jgi:hypothetical protein
MTLRRVLILADESADWIIAGLRQLDRLAFSLNEYVVQNKQSSPIVVTVWWKPTAEKSRQWIPNDNRLANIIFSSEIEGRSFDLILGTRSFLYRNALPQLVGDSHAKSESTFTPNDLELWEMYSKQLGTLPAKHRAWEYLTAFEQVADVERRFLQASGKFQDGFVSRYLNRPISRPVTRLLLRFPTTPNAWTLLIFPIPILASLILLHGTYWSFLWGLVLFQIFSVLDGCDGEIARAKFLESERGRRLDDLFDIFSNILLAGGLGFGLARQAGLAGHSGAFYLAEGIATAVIIGANEIFLATRESSANDKNLESLGDTLYPRHRELVERSGLLVFGKQFASALIQLTKRDVAVLFFVLLAAIGRPAWILHLLFAVTSISLGLAVKASTNRIPR